MACNSTGTFYWAGVTFQSATQLYTDSNLTIVAADGWYSIGGFYREMTGGILGPTQNCPSCITPTPCSSMKFYDPTMLLPPTVDDGFRGRYNAEYNAGSGTGAVLVIFSVSSFNTSPARCTWTYDGVSASEYSSSTFGYLEGLIAPQSLGTPGEANCSPSSSYYNISNLNGSFGNVYPGREYTWNPVYTAGQSHWQGNMVVVPNLMGPYTNQINGGVGIVGPLTLSKPGPGNSMMVIPKPNASPSVINLQMEAICFNSYWSVRILCPIRLNEFKAGVVGGICGDTSLPFLYTANPGNVITSITNGSTTSKLTDTTKDFNILGVLVGDRVQELNTGLSAEITDISLASSGILGIQDVALPYTQGATAILELSGAIYYIPSQSDNITGVSNIIQEHDWIFLDPNGENYCPAGAYPVTIPALGGNHFVTVGPNSVVTNVVPC